MKKTPLQGCYQQRCLLCEQPIILQLKQLQHNLCLEEMQFEIHTKFEANWNFIHSRKQKIIQQNNKRENSKRLAHKYVVGDKVLMAKESKSKYGHVSYEGPYTVRKVNNNGTVRIQKGAITDTFNIRLIKPYKT